MRSRGFSLLELLIVFILIGILSLLSYPSYSRYLVKSRRIHIKSFLLAVAARLERYHIERNTYVGAESEMDFSKSGKYYELDPVFKKNSYVLKAIPVGSQMIDRGCGSLILDQKGDRDSTGFKSAEECWL